MTTPMPLGDYLVIALACSAAMFVCRTLPIFFLKGRELPAGVTRALGLIPAAAFAALVTNDLFDPAKMSGPVWGWAAPLIAAVAVAVVGAKTKSMAWCIVVGVAALALLTWGSW